MTEKNIFAYEIGGKKYEQRPMVLGQVRQLMTLLQSVKFGEDMSETGIIAALGDKLPQAIAIALKPENCSLKDKNVAALAADIEFEISPDLALEIVEDFFGCNPIASLLEKIGTAAKRITRQIGESRSNSAASSSQTEISEAETASSGAIV